MNLVTRAIALEASTYAADRPFRGIGFHHTATDYVPWPVRGGSWHFCVAKDGLIYADVPLDRVAHHIGMTDRWRPDWVVRSKVATSDINYCSIGIEIVYAPQVGEVPTTAQRAAVGELVGSLYGDYGRLPIVGHGEVDSSKWPTEPHLFDWTAFTAKDPRQGRYYQGEDMPTITELQQQIADLQGQLDNLNGINTTLGDQVNSLNWLLGVSQQETRDRDAVIAQLKAQLDTQNAPPLLKAVLASFSDGSTREFLPH